MSPLTTLTFETLRERNTRDLAEKRAQLNTLSGTGAERTIRAQQRRTQGRLQDLLAHGEEIEQLADTAPQQQLGGRAEQWKKELVLLRDISDEDERALVWNAYPDCTHKRFQELFCDPKDFCVPAYNPPAKKRVHFRANPYTVSVEGCLVRPDRIPDDLALALQLCDFSDCARKPFERLRRKHAAIPRLKKLWDAAWRIERDQRLLVLTQPGARLQAQYPAIPDPDASVLGMLLRVRSSGREESPRNRKRDALIVRELEVQVCDAYRARRMPDHATHSYEKELATLTDIMHRVDQANRNLDRWRRDTPEEEKRALWEEARSAIVRVTGRLGQPLNAEKRRAQELLTNAQEMEKPRRDGKTQRSPSAVMAQLVASLNRLSARLSEVPEKGGYMRMDSQRLESRLTAEEKRLKEFRASIITGATVLEQDHLLFHAEIDWDATGRNQAATNIVKRMKLDPALLTRISLRPLRTYAERLLAEYAELHPTLAAGDRDTAITRLLRMHLIGKLQALHTCIEHFKKQFMAPTRVPIGDARTFMTKLRELFGRKEIFPHIRLPDLDPLFQELKNTLATIEEHLRSFETATTDDERIEQAEAFRMYLKGIDILQHLELLHTPHAQVKP